MNKIWCGAISCVHYQDNGSCNCKEVSLSSTGRHNAAGEFETCLICKQYEESEEYKNLKQMLYKQLGIEA